MTDQEIAKNTIENAYGLIEENHELITITYEGLVEAISELITETRKEADARIKELEGELEAIRKLSEKP